ncbi:MAG: hypothetical protein JNK04_21835, partial [Myxococcales bacterium]|nr:hypothetical protein [Myxococcales bacterium]
MSRSKNTTGAVKARAKTPAAKPAPKPAAKAKAEAEPEFWNLRLYIAGQSSKCLAAVRNLNRFCEEHLADRYKIEVVDLLENPR